METRQAILERALQLFAARGYDAIGVQEICEAAGITKPTLYHHGLSFQGHAELNEKLAYQATHQFSHGIYS